MQRPPQCCIYNPCLHVRYRIHGVNPTHLSCPRTGKQQWLHYQHLDPPPHPQCMLKTIRSAVSRSTILHPCLCNTCLRTIAAVPTTSPHNAAGLQPVHNIVVSPASDSSNNCHIDITLIPAGYTTNTQPRHIASISDCHHLPSANARQSSQLPHIAQSPDTASAVCAMNSATITNKCIMQPDLQRFIRSTYRRRITAKSTASIGIIAHPSQHAALYRQHLRSLLCSQCIRRTIINIAACGTIIQHHTCSTCLCTIAAVPTASKVLATKQHLPTPSPRKTHSAHR
jgi:hypothetical protein